MRAQSAVPSKHAEHTHQGLMCTLRIHFRNWCVPEHMGQKLMRTLSIRISFLRYAQHKRKNSKFLKVPSKHAEHARNELMHALSVSFMNWCARSECARSECASEIKLCVAPPNIKVTCLYVSPKVTYPERLHGAKTIENLHLRTFKYSLIKPRSTLIVLNTYSHGTVCIRKSGVEEDGDVVMYHCSLKKEIKGGFNM